MGEVHATLLAESGFFKFASRPEDLPAPTKVAIQALQADTVAKGTGEWFLHMVSALEAEGRYQEAMIIAESTLIRRFLPERMEAENRRILDEVATLEDEAEARTPQFRLRVFIQAGEFPSI